MRASGSSVDSYQKRSVPATRHIGSSRRSPFMSPASATSLPAPRYRKTTRSGHSTSGPGGSAARKASTAFGLSLAVASSARKRANLGEVGAGAEALAAAPRARHSTRTISFWPRAKKAPSA